MIDEEEQVEIGGIALTEEAAETHTPDLVALEISTMQKKAAVVNTTEVGADADVRMQNIMAQV
jgi:hypothetical protein